MELLTIEHKDFTLSIECSKWEGVWGKAKGNVKEENLYSTYSWSEGVEEVALTADRNEVVLENNAKGKAIFFDNAEYPVWVDFKNEVTDAAFGTDLQKVQENFSFHKKRHVLSGFLNYGNDIGKSEIQLVYKLDSGEIRNFTFGYEVLSTKLNYHEHWAAIINDIEEEYRMLSIDYLRRTFHSFKPDSSGNSQEIIWWNIFKGEQEKFIKAVKRIIERPRHKLRGNEIYLRADKLKRLTPQIEQELAEHRKEPAHLYRTEEQIQSHDTMENRFLKYALTMVANKYDKLKRVIEHQGKTTKEFKEELDNTKKRLDRLCHNPFFRNIGPFKGLNQESQVLQKASDYSQVYRTWCLLRKSYSLNDGIYRLQTKDIATLYEIWCFIEVSHIVRELLGDEAEVDHRNRMELNGMFTFDLGKGENSRILFKKDGIQLAELIYNPKHTEKENDSVSIESLVVKTVPQKPDIVLQLTKQDLEKDMKMTYLFDAKYRIDGKSNGVDTPPDDAINQMHRYRDAIYYQDKNSMALKKEVIGGYILFPGYAKTKEDIEETGFYKSISDVNIGAFPLRPKDEGNRALLVDFIKELLDMQACKIVDEVISQKGVKVEVPNRVLVGYVKGDKKIKEFEDGTATLYYTGSRFPTTIPLHDLHFFAPYIKDKGVRDVYEVTQIRTITSREAKGDGGDDLRLAFHLANPRRLFKVYRPVPLNVDYSFRDSTFEEIKKNRW